MKKLLGLLTILLTAATVAPAVVHAQATRTWVSGVGDDVNPCSRTAPCKTFAGAISKTAAGGIINCLDPGGFGTVTITKSITIDCSEVLAGSLASGTNGINVSAASTDTIRLVGLDIEGSGGGVIGVNYLAAGAVHIEKCRIYSFTGSTAAGIRVATSSGAELFVSDTTVEDNGSASTGGGIVITPSGSSATYVSVNNVKLNNNLVGLLADASGGTGSVRVHVRGSTAAGNINAGFAATTSSGLVSILIDGSSAVNNASTGVYVQGANAQILIGNSTVAYNSYGVSAASGGQLYTFGTNQIVANSVSDGTPIPNGLQRF